VSPLLEIFTRDNTNDGDGWDVRLSHVVPLANFGYPKLFAHFGDEIVQPLADYGGGAPTGALWVSEPNMPKGFGDTLYTVDWGRSAVYRHPLQKQGATYKDKLTQSEFVHIPSPTDMDVDGFGPDLRLELARRRIQLLEPERRVHCPAHPEELEV